MLLEDKEPDEVLEPLSEMFRRLKAIASAKELIANHEEAIRELMSKSNFEEALRYLKLVSPELFEKLKEMVEG